MHCVVNYFVMQFFYNTHIINYHDASFYTHPFSFGLCDALQAFIKSAAKIALAVVHGTSGSIISALCMLKMMDDLMRQQMSLIASNAISEIDRIAVLVSSRNTASNRGSHNNAAASES